MGDPTARARARQAALAWDRQQAELLFVGSIRRDALVDVASDVWEPLVRDLADELAKHGWGDFHYGSTGQEPRVADLVRRARIALGEDVGTRATTEEASPHE